MTTPPSAASGKAPRIGPSHSMVATSTTTETSECSWVWAPMAWARTVRLPLELTGKPERAPAPRLAAPRARNSWLLSILSRRFRANALPVRTLSL
jgi:hypothetical protein